MTAPTIDFDALRPQIAELCRKYGVLELSVFGSMARGDDRPDSDVDFLYLADDAMRLQDLLDLEEELVRLLGRPVDLVPKMGLHRVIRRAVIDESRVLYAA